MADRAGAVLDDRTELPDLHDVVYAVYLGRTPAGVFPSTAPRQKYAPAAGAELLADKLGRHLNRDQQTYLAQFVATLTEDLVRSIGHTGSVPDIPPDELAEDMSHLLPSREPVNEMADQVGPEFYDTKGVRSILARRGARAISKQAVEQRRKNRRLLALRTTDGTWIYPTWQFVEHRVMAGLPELLAAFAGHDEWAVATWMTGKVDDLDGRRPVDCLTDTKLRARALLAATQTASRWAA